MHAWRLPSAACTPGVYRPPHARLASTVRPMHAWRLPSAGRRRLAHQLTPDEEAPDLARARANFVQLGVAQQPPGGVLADVTVAA
eukprot:355873-Chlamydomonas_euryale.AAC.5